MLIRLTSRQWYRIARGVFLFEVILASIIIPLTTVIIWPVLKVLGVQIFLAIYVLVCLWSVAQAWQIMQKARLDWEVGDRDVDKEI